MLMPSADCGCTTMEPLSTDLPAHVTDLPGLTGWRTALVGRIGSNEAVQRACGLLWTV